jgi:hypothetical protein
MTGTVLPDLEKVEINFSLESPTFTSLVLILVKKVEEEI